MVAFRLLLEEFLRPIFSNATVETMGDLKGVLENLASKRRTTKLWVDCFVKPMLTILKYVRTESVADWPLHVLAV